MLSFVVVLLVCLQQIHAVHVDLNYYGQNGGAVERPKKEHEKGQDLTKIPGIPGHDYPIFHKVPETSFSCHNVPAHPGMYANVETGCQAYHVCHDGREGHQGASFLCTNGTIFNQKEFACDWWYNVNCHEAQNYYRLNLDPEHNPYFPKKKPQEEQAPEHGYQQVDEPVQYHHTAPEEQYHVQVAYQQAGHNHF